MTVNRQTEERRDGAGQLEAEPMHPQELVMTLLGSYVHHRCEAVWSGGLVTLLIEMGFSRGAARAALTRLVRRGLIERVRSGRLIHYRITTRAERVLNEGDRRIFSLGEKVSNDERWTMLWHEIPESQRLERGRLARRLRFLGFGTLQDGLWISPHDREDEVRPLLAELNVSGRATMLVGSVVGPESAVAVVRRAWDLDRLCRRYREFAERFGPYARKRGAPRTDDREAFLVRTRAIHLYRGFPFLDPDLPSELLPDPSARTDAVRTFNIAYERLSAAACRHFDAATSSWQ